MVATLITSNLDANNTMSHLIRRTVMFVILLAFILLVLACEARPVPPSPNSNSSPNTGPPVSNGPPASNPAPQPPPNVEEEKPDVELTPVEYQLAFASGKRVGYDKYYNRSLKVTGVVTGYGHNLQGEGHLFLGADVTFTCEEKRPSAKALPGQTATLRGKVTNALGVEKWTIEKVTGTPPPTVTAEQFLQDLAADKAGTNAKWKGKCVIVSGTITKAMTRNGQIYLTPADKQPFVSCWFYSANNAEVNRDRFGQYKVGQKVRILGYYERDGMVGRCEPLDEQR